MAATSGTTFDIDIVAPADSAEAAAAAVETLAGQLTQAGAAATQAAEAVKAGEAAYKQAENAADRTAKALEKIGVAADAQRGKLQAAMNVGDTKGAERAASALQKLTVRQAEAAQKSNAAKVALASQAAELDRLKVASVAASGGQAKLTESLQKAKVAAAEVSKVQAAARGTGNLGKLSGALGQLGGPLGSMGNKATAAADAWANLKETLGAAGPYVAIAVALVAISTALVGATAAATVWLVKMAGGTKQVNAIHEKFKKNVDGLFQGQKMQSGLALLLDGLDHLAGLFDANSVTGKAMAVVLDDLGGGLLTYVSSLIPKVIAGFIQLQIWILKALIMIKPYGSTIMGVVEALATFAAVVVGVFVGAIALGIAIVTAFIALPTLLGKAFEWAGEKIVEFGKGAIDFLSNLSLEQLGTDLIAGLVTGIAGGGGAVVEALTGVVDGAVNAAKSALGIASPSKVFAEIGANTAAGMASGVEDESGSVQGAIESMVSPPAAVESAAPAAGASASAGGGSDFGGATFNFYGVKDAEDAQSKFEAMLARAARGLFAMAAGGEEPAT